MMTKQMVVLWPWIGRACKNLVLISIVLIGCQRPPTNHSSILTDSEQNPCISLAKVRCPVPPIYDKNSIDGVEIAFPEWIGKLQILHREQVFESDDGGESWRTVTWPTSIMNEDLDIWPVPPSNSVFRYRRMAVPVEAPYYDYYGMHREKRWFIEVSKDAGKTWRRAKGRIVNSTESIDSHTLLAYHPRDPSIFYISAPIIGSSVLAGLYETKDGGDSFELKLVGRSIVYFAISHSNPSIMYAKNEFGNIVKSENAGEWWTILSQDREIRELVVSKKTDKGMEEIRYPDGNEIYQIEIDPTDAETVYILSEKGLLRTKDGGKNWCVLNLGPGITTAVNSMVLINRKPGTIIIGTWAGLYRSRDGGDTWSKVQIASR